MEFNALTKFVRISDKKVREVTHVLRVRKVDEAVQMLKFVPRKFAYIVEKTISSTIANTEYQGIRKEALMIKAAITKQGVEFRPFIPVSRGSTNPIRKRMNHIRIVLTDNLS